MIRVADFAPPAASSKKATVRKMSLSPGHPRATESTVGAACISLSKTEQIIPRCEREKYSAQHYTWTDVANPLGPMNITVDLFNKHL